MLKAGSLDTWLCTFVQVMPGEVMPVYSDREFDHVLKKHADQLVVVCASSSDCVPCRGFEPVYEVYMLLMQHLLKGLHHIGRAVSAA